MGYVIAVESVGTESVGVGPGTAGPKIREAAARYEAHRSTVSDLGEQICSLAAHIHAATFRFLTLIARFDRLRGWEAEGHKSCAYWLAYRTGLDLGTAREHVRVARALEELPITGKTMSRGDLSFSQVRALTRVAEPENEADLVEVARGTTTAKLERMVRAWKIGTRRTEAELERERHDARKLSVFPDDEGMYVIHGRLEPEVGAVVQRAIEAAGDELYRPERVSSREAARRRADALGLLAERALAGARVGDGGSSVADARDDGDGAIDGPAEGRPTPVSRADRYQVVLHVDAQTLTSSTTAGTDRDAAEDCAAADDAAKDDAAEDGAAADRALGRSELEDGTRVSAETSRRIACDSSLVKVTRGKDGSVLDVGRRTRTISPALRRALQIRDGGCTFPGCGSRHADAHHVVHWADGGETCLDNTLLLCRHHHRLVHEDGWEVRWAKPGTPVFTPPEGVANDHADVPRSRPSRVTICRKRFLAKYGKDANPMEAARLWKTTADIPEDILMDA